MKVAIRADASVRLGSGHVTRCITLALALRNAGADVTFVSCTGEGDLHGLIADRGFAINALQHPTDVTEAQSALGEIHPDLLIVDHYLLDAPWESIMRDVAGKIFVIDDLADRQHDCDLLLDQNLGFDKERSYASLVGDNTQILLGPRFALLRDQFRAPLARARVRGGEIRRVLVTMGGFDADDATSKVVSELSASNVGAEIRVALPESAPHAKEVSALCARLERVTFLGAVAHMASEMEQADLAIGACGTSAWERAALGLPAIHITLAENQRPGARACASARIAVDLGDLSSLPAGAIKQAFERLAQSPATVRMMSEAARAITGASGQFSTDRTVSAVLDVAAPAASADN